MTTELIIGYGEGIASDERPDLIHNEENWHG